jgi:hypothetical protein
MSLNIFNVENKEEVDRCIVCLESLDSETQYKLPECNHAFHQNCIMHWFREGNSKCPLCNNLGINNVPQPTSTIRTRWYARDKYKFKIIRQYSRRKDAPVFLKKSIQKLKDMENNLKETAAELREHKNKTGVFKELRKKHGKLKSKKWRLHKRIFNMKIGIANINIVPLIIAKKQNV